MRRLNVCRPVAEWRDPRHRRGIAGEVAAARYLESIGFSILAHRFRLGHHDVDLIARLHQLVVFVEVKTRSPSDFGSGLESIGWRKRRDLARVATTWIARHGCPDDGYRFDVVTVRFEDGSFPKVVHVAGAFVHVEK